ncbi:MAG TPA: ATP-binding protein [Oligoflexus sp.]|uniref:ATP-binding protein n=1 Tax=Oligoflexus sp. TaxID=1971216 RepID=UPI002D524200|nr:ATP-binding protein [Oligoflexus sp.]HYX34698.1 ATP-binding protein [Oligoflexus sp.]
MQRVAARIESLLKWAYNVTEERFPDLVHRTEVVGAIWFALIAVITYIVYIPVFLFVFPNLQAAASLVLVGLSSTALSLWIMRRYKSLYHANLIGCIGGALNMIAISWVSGGAWSTAFAWIALSVISIFLITTTKTGVYFTIVFASLAGAVAVSIHPRESGDWGFQFPLFSQRHVYFNAIIQFGSILWVGYFAYIFKSKQTAALLESEVAKKRVRTLLDHIPQGVLSIEADGRISNDFSAHLADVLNTTPAAGMSFKDLVLDRCTMGSDEKDQAWQAILSSAGEISLNFDINVSKLPTEFVFVGGGSPRYLKATWNAVMDGGFTTQILVTLLDVTEEKALERETQVQRSVLELIQELLIVPAGKMSQFFSTTIPLLSENRRIVENVEVPLTDSSVRMLFVNAHTVKGAARTLQLKALARTIHDMEERYADIIKRGLPIDRKRLKDDVDEAFRVLNAYVSVNRDKLNRTDSYSKVIIERDFLESHCHVMKDMIKGPFVDVEKIVLWLRDQCDALTSMIFEQLPGIFDGYKEQAIKIARDIGKADPIFDFQIDPVSIGPEQRIAIDNCMIHILRNSLDHGIEMPAERLAAGKPQSGFLSIAAQAGEIAVRITIRDDGRGLALGKLRERGLQSGMLNSSSSDLEVAQTIFAPGTSTATAVSDISGRGIGMSAVRSFIEKVGGTITIQLRERKDPAGNFCDFAFEITLPLGHGAH